MTLINFKMGERNTLTTAHKEGDKGDVLFVKDGYNGQLWFIDDQGNLRNVVPEVLDAGDWNVITTSCCFIPGTKILLDFNGHVNYIEEIKAGDTVISYDVIKDTFYQAIVKKLIVNKNSKHMAKIYFSNGEVLEMTDYHPLYTSSGFHSLTNHLGYDTLKIGDDVKCFDGWSTIINIEQYELDTPITTYNLDVINFNEKEDDDINDTFIANGFVAHNAACPS